MKIILLVCILFASASTLETHQDFVDNADANQEEEKPDVGGSLNRPYGKHYSLSMFYFLFTREINSRDTCGYLENNRFECN